MRTSAVIAHRLLHAVGLAVSVVIAVAAFAASAASTPVLGYDDARHLLARTGFGPTDAEVRTYATLTREAAVAKLLKETQTTASTTPPGGALDTSPLQFPNPETSSAEEKASFMKERRDERVLALVEHAFEAGIASVLGVGDEEEENTQESPEDIEFRRELLAPLIERSGLGHLKERPALNRAILGTLIEHSMK